MKFNSSQFLPWIHIFAEKTTTQGKMQVAIYNILENIYVAT